MVHSLHVGHVLERSRDARKKKSSPTWLTDLVATGHPNGWALPTDRAGGQCASARKAASFAATPCRMSLPQREELGLPTIRDSLH